MINKIPKFYMKTGLVSVVVLHHESCFLYFFEEYICILFFFFFSSFLAALWHMDFPSQESDLSHIFNLPCCCGNTGSLTYWDQTCVPETLQIPLCPSRHACAFFLKIGFSLVAYHRLSSSSLC